MADLTGILGTMLATGMGGHSRRGPAFSASPFGMGGGAGGLGTGAMGMSAGRGGMDFKHVAGLGALGYLAYKAFQERQQNMGGQGTGSSTGVGTGTGTGTGIGTGGGIFGGLFGGGQGGGSLSDRLSSVFSPGQAQTPDPQARKPDTPATTAYPDVAMEDQQALLLIRAMIAAANADGEITQEESQRIIAKLDEAGAGPDERQVVERELANPVSMDSLVAAVRDQQTAEQVYLASALAIDPDTDAERSYLQYLAARLKLEPQRAEDLHRIA